MTEEMQDVTRRLADLEQQVARLTAALFDEKRDPDQELVARAFVLADAEGNHRAELGLRENCCGFWLLDVSGNPRIALTVLEEGQPEVRICDTDGRALISIREKDAESTINFFHDGGSQFLSLSISNKGPNIFLANTNTNQKLTLRLTPAGQADLFMGDQVGPSLKLAIDSKEPYLLLGKDNKTVWSAG